MAQLVATKPAPGIVAAACDALGLSRATLYRRCAAAVRPLVARLPRPAPARKLCGATIWIRKPDNQDQNP